MASFWGGRGLVRSNDVDRFVRLNRYSLATKPGCLDQIDIDAFFEKSGAARCVSSKRPSEDVSSGIMVSSCILT